MALLFKNATILTGRTPQTFQADVLVEGDRISKMGHVLPMDCLPDLTVVDASNSLLTPGFINGHVHLSQLLNRGQLDNLSTEDLLHEMHSRHHTKSDTDRYWASLMSISEGLRCGTTFFSVFTTSIGLIGRAMNDAGIRGYLTVAKKDQWWGEGRPPKQFATEDILESMEREVAAWSDPIVAISVGVPSDRAATPQLLSGISRLARERGLHVAIHVSEGITSVDLSIRNRGCRPIEFLYDQGFLGPHVSLVHACNLNKLEIELVRGSGASICHCPISNARTVAGTMPLRAIEDAQIPICLGTDSSSTGNTNNVLVEGYAALLLHRIANADAGYPSAERIFRMLTCEGAQALGYEGQLGEIAPGFRADIALWDLDQSCFFPNRNVVSSLINCASDLAASQVYVGGRLVFNKRPVLFDINEVRERLRLYGEALGPRR